MSSLLERIAARRTELAEQAQHLTKQLTDVQHELDRVSVAEQVITQTPEPEPQPEPEAVGRDMAAPATGTAFSSGSVIIPYRHQVSGADELSADYRLLLQTVTDAGNHEGLALANLGGALLKTQRFDEAITTYQDALAIFRELNDRNREGTALARLGFTQRRVQRLDEAIATFEEARTVLKSLGDNNNLDIVQINL